LIGWLPGAVGPAILLITQLVFINCICGFLGTHDVGAVVWFLATELMLKSSNSDAVAPTHHTRNIGLKLILSEVLASKLPLISLVLLHAPDGIVAYLLVSSSIVNSHNVQELYIAPPFRR